MTPAIELREVHKRYGTEAHVDALKQVSLTIETGELVSIVGPSGSGKTTLLHIMGALLRPTSGTLRIAGRPTSSLSDPELSALRAYELGFVFQNYVLTPGASALENVADGLLYCGVSRRERLRSAHEVLDRVGLVARTTHIPTQLSGGERQRVAIARALVGNPTLVLADEPTGNLDTQTGAAILALLTSLNADGVTMALITHDPDVAAAAPRTIEMRDGRVIADRGTDANTRRA
ncbi:MAG: ABC transporter ATP-binding protein [Solirubrobacterales bacterium]|nr:ABC transporter ATP-binding protein [Solirubrobacterales bacterium]